MSDILLGVRVFAIEVAVAGHQLCSRDFPGLVIPFPLLPPFQTGLEFFELEGLSLGVVLTAFGQRVFVIPNIPGRS